MVLLLRIHYLTAMSYAVSDLNQKSDLDSGPDVMPDLNMFLLYRAEKNMVAYISGDYHNWFYCP